MSYTYPGREAVAVKALSDVASASLGMTALLVGISLTRQDESGVTDGVDKPSHILDEGELAEEDVWRSVSFARCNAGATTCAMALRMRQTTGLHRAEMGGLLRQLPDGLGTMVRQRGKRFSGEERQRRHRQMPCSTIGRCSSFDQATSHLDAEHEEGSHGHPR